MLLRALFLSTIAPLVLAGTNEFGRQFLAKKAAEEGVVSLPSGLLYKVLREGDGEEHPLKDTQCSCHYEGRTAQEYSKSPKGKTFDSSYSRGDPTSFAPSGVIAGWTEAMQLMVAGDKWELYIPSELAYGDSGQGGDIGAGDCLIFTMEILKIEGPGKPAERGPPPFTELAGVDDYVSWQAGAPRALAVLRQPTKTAKLFSAFKAAARSAAKAGDDAPAAFALTADSRFVKGGYTKDAVAEKLKLSAPAFYTTPDGGATWSKCATSRPTEASVEQLAAQLQRCVASPTTGAAKAEL